MNATDKGKARPAARELKDLVDLYIAGFPCQPFSSAATGQGNGIKDCRGRLWTHILEFIVVAKPQCAIMENVVGLTRGNTRNTLSCIMALLNGMTDYVWDHKILNTNSFGIPQHRERLYIVVFRRDCLTQDFKWPVASLTQYSLDMVLDPPDESGCQPDLQVFPSQVGPRKKCVAALQKLIDMGWDMHTPAVCSVRARTASSMIHKSPCLTARRVADGGALAALPGEVHDKQRYLPLSRAAAKAMAVVIGRECQ